MKHVKHIFFDLDHTLWDFDKNSHEAISHLFNKDNVQVSCKTDFHTFIKIYEAINRELWQLYAVKQITKEELRYQRFHKTFLHFNFDDLNLAKRWADDYLTISPYKTHLIEGAVDVLNYLKQKGYMLHIITNGFKEVQHIKLETSNLKTFFHHIIISEEHGVNKPDIKIFELAQQFSGSKHAECIMIGDNYDTDIVGALNAGWKAIYFSDIPQQNSNKGFYTINKLALIKELL